MTSLTFLNNRHYDPSVGVFVSVDPLVDKTMQPYLYGAANPITHADPTGLCPFSGCWEAFDAYLRGLREAAAHVQDDSELSPGSRLPSFRIVRHAEKMAAWSLDFNNPIGLSGAPVASRTDPEPDLDRYWRPEDCSGPLCSMWEHRRGLLQIAGVVVGGACVFGTAGLAAPACLGGGSVVAGASVTQSAFDNNIVGGGAPCWGAFAVDAVVNVGTTAVPALAGSRAIPGAALTTSEQAVVNALSASTSSGMAHVTASSNHMGTGCQ